MSLNNIIEEIKIIINEIKVSLFRTTLKDIGNIILLLLFLFIIFNISLGLYNKFIIKNVYIVLLLWGILIVFILLFYLYRKKIYKDSIVFAFQDEFLLKKFFSVINKKSYKFIFNLINDINQELGNKKIKIKYNIKNARFLYFNKIDDLLFYKEEYNIKTIIYFKNDGNKYYVDFLTDNNSMKVFFNAIKRISITSDNIEIIIKLLIFYLLNISFDSLNTDEQGKIYYNLFDSIKNGNFFIKINELKNIEIFILFYYIIFTRGEDIEIKKDQEKNEHIVPKIDDYKKKLLYPFLVDYFMFSLPSILEDNNFKNIFKNNIFLFWCFIRVFYNVFFYTRFIYYNEENYKKYGFDKKFFVYLRRITELIVLYFPKNFYNYLLNRILLYWFLIDKNIVFINNVKKIFVEKGILDLNNLFYNNKIGFILGSKFIAYILFALFKYLDNEDEYIKNIDRLMKYKEDIKYDSIYNKTIKLVSLNLLKDIMSYNK